MLLLLLPPHFSSLLSLLIHFFVPNSSPIPSIPVFLQSFFFSSPPSHHFTPPAVPHLLLSSSPSPSVRLLSPSPPLPPLVYLFLSSSPSPPSLVFLLHFSFSSPPVLVRDLQSSSSNLPPTLIFHQLSFFSSSFSIPFPPVLLFQSSFSLPLSVLQSFSSSFSLPPPLFFLQSSRISPRSPVLLFQSSSSPYSIKINLSIILRKIPKFKVSAFYAQGWHNAKGYNISRYDFAMELIPNSGDSHGVRRIFWQSVPSSCSVRSRGNSFPERSLWSYPRISSRRSHALDDQRRIRDVRGSRVSRRRTHRREFPRWRVRIGLSRMSLQSLGLLYEKDVTYLIFTVKDNGCSQMTCPPTGIYEI